MRQVTNVKLPDALRLSGLLGELQYIEFARSCRPLRRIRHETMSNL
ncbi:hypothetical protein AYO07_04510 [Escherichia coli]|nr:hypothetical protein AYO07_04510 [Escherichia coli]